jgi:hypothetical protein
MRRDLTIALAYVGVYLAACLLGLGLTGAAIGGFNALPRDLRLGALSGVWVGIALNVVPAIVVGVTLFYLVARSWARERTVPSRHIVRAAPLYAAAALFCVILIVGLSSSRETGFGLIAQLFVSPALVALGGLAADVLAWRGVQRARAAV